MASGDRSIPPEVVARITKHMNEDHGDSVLAYAQWYGKRIDAKWASIVDMDLDAMKLGISSEPSGPATEEITVPYIRPLETAKDARKLMIDMANESAKALGVEIKRDNH
ncbi:hypothetical protein DFJ74DRAFT_674692 [Hyaloraphidium curvatum]|nr:hypothetical protein DFJ74DRAFT_674692 [Hyaloraphidium curvatum]